MVYTVGICDDETIQIKVEILYLKEIARRKNIDIKCKGFENSDDLISCLKQQPLDVLLLDIDLKNEVSGIELAVKLMASYPRMVIIFVTGHREFAYEAFDIEATGYIVKPIEINKFERILLKAFQLVNGMKKTRESTPLVITEENIKKKISQEDIIYIHREGTKSFIITKQREYRVYETIASIFKRLKGDFLRINQSEIVNGRRIKEIRDNQIYLNTGEIFPIGRTFRNNVIEAYFGQKE